MTQTSAIIWDNQSRIDAIGYALRQLPHEEEAVGLGFKLVHNPANCKRCRATISLLELSAIIHHLENDEDNDNEDE